MSSTPTTRNRFEKQGFAENHNQWGHVHLNKALDAIDQALDGVATVDLSAGDVTLAVSDYDATSDGRNRVLILAGALTADRNVVIPNRQKTYFVVNKTTGGYTASMKTSAGAAQPITQGYGEWVTCDGADTIHSARIGEQVALARDWAVKTAATVDGSDYSAKEWAVGTTVAAGSAMEWATVTAATVDGSAYSAKEHAIGDLTASGGSAKAWATDASSPDGSGAKSAKTLAGEAATSASNAATSESSASSSAANADYFRAKSQEWAESATEPGGTGTKSAKTWAGEAAASAASIDPATLLYRDGSAAPTANLPMGGFRHTGMGGATERSHYARADQVQDGRFVWGGTAGGGANALTLSLTPTITALAAGMVIRFKVASTNTLGVTLNVSGTGDKLIVKNDNANLEAGDLLAGSIVEVVVDAAANQYRMLRTPLPVPIADQTAAEGGTESGTLMTPQRTAQAIAAQVPLTKHYRSAEQTVTAAGLLTLGHGFGEAPKLVTFKLKFLNATAGYSVGDTIAIGATGLAPGQNNLPALSAILTSSAIEIIFYDAASIFTVLNKGTGRYETLSNSDVSLIAEAFA